MVLGYFIYMLAIKYLTMPVIVTFSTKETPVFEVPFPTITICSKAKIDGEHFNYTDIMLKTRTNVTLTKKEQDLSNYAAWICEDEIGKKSFRDKYYKTQISEDIYEFLSKVGFLYVYLIILWSRYFAVEKNLYALLLFNGFGYEMPGLLYANFNR